MQKNSCGFSQLFLNIQRNSITKTMGQLLPTLGLSYSALILSDMNPFYVYFA